MQLTLYVYCRYGFDEPAGNFQQYNFGRGGAENNGVIVFAQNEFAYNNAFFVTPPDGFDGMMGAFFPSKFNSKPNLVP